MKKQIKALMEKQYLTGDEAGRLMILDLLFAYQNLSSGKGSKGLLTDAEKMEVVSRLQLPDDIRRFNDYRTLHDYLSFAPTVMESFAKTYEVCCLKLFYLLSNMKRVEEEAARLKSRPVIMTKKQFERFVEAGEEAPLCGIAVLQTSPHAEASIDENGYYVNETSEINDECRAEQVLLNHSNLIKDAVFGMNEMLAECLARKKVLELIASYTKIPQIKKLAKPLEVENLSVLNDLMLSAVDSIKREEPGAEADIKARLLELLTPVDLSALEPTPQAVRKARRTLNFSVIKNSNEALVALLKREWAQ